MKIVTKQPENLSVILENKLKMSTEYAPEFWINIPIVPTEATIFGNDEYRKNMVDFVSGAVGGTAGLMVGHPLDTVKTVTQNSKKRLAISEGFAGIGQHGYKTFYKGLSLPIWSYAAVNACLFSSYQICLRFLDPDETSFTASAISGAFAGVAQLIPGTPVDVIKIHMQNDAIKKNVLPKQGPFAYASKIISKDGFFGLYKGVTIHAMRDVPAFIIYFYSYKFSNELSIQYNLVENSFWRTFISGAIAGALSWVLLIPQDVMKTRIQAGVDKNIRESFRSLRTIGLESFFRGGVMLTLRALLVNAITFAVYEKCSEKLTVRHKQDTLTFL